MGLKELRSAGVQAARAAREALATAVSALGNGSASEFEPLARDLSTTVGQLHTVEIRDAPGTFAALDTSMTRLRAALVELQSTQSQGQLVDIASEVVARSLALLYPARRELERGLEAPALESEVAEPVLELSRQKDTDRRVAPRVAVEADIGFQSETNFFTGFSGDLSDGGIFVATYDILPIGTVLTVSFVLPGGSHVAASGHVTWVREPVGLDSNMQPGMGVSFDGLSEEEQAAIISFLHRRAPMFYDA